MALGEQLEALAAAEALPGDYPAMARRWFTPLAEWLVARRQRQEAPLLVGVNGAQGTGKTTACAVLCLMLEARGLRGLTLALDDFYLDRASRLKLARQVHPLLATRGVPGTHEIDLLSETLERLLDGQPVALPVFDKAQDDRLPRQRWRQAEPADVLLFEGWCVGARPESEAALAEPLNALEATEDVDATWRHYVNRQLAGPYASLFSRLHALVMLRAPSLQRVMEWRQLQEEKLARNRSGAGVMSPREVEHFVEHYERVTRHCLAEMPSRADYLLEVGDDHKIRGARSH
jgi:D-glycerate 3-kinase